MRQAMKCRDCQHFDSPEYPPQRELGACDVDGLEKMPPDAPACECFAVSWVGNVRLRNEERDARWEAVDV